jgi:hypothetical protein
MTNEFLTFILTHSWILVLVVAWSIFWKGIALWRASRNNSLAWFIILLVINTLGLLEIIYIVFFSRKTALPQATEIEETKTSSPEPIAEAPIAGIPEPAKEAEMTAEPKDPEEIAVEIKKETNLDEQKTSI